METRAECPSSSARLLFQEPRVWMIQAASPGLGREDSLLTVSPHGLWDHLIDAPTTPLPLSLCWLVPLQSACNVGDLGLIPGVGKILWRRAYLPNPVFWPGEFHGLYSPWGLKELDTTEQLSLTHFCLDCSSCVHGWPCTATHPLRETFSGRSSIQDCQVPSGHLLLPLSWTTSFLALISL